MPRTRKFSGPLRPGTKSTRTRVAKKPRGGLNKVEKKQTKSIVESAIKKEHALKYFNSQSSDDAVAPQVSIVSNKDEVSVIGYSSTTEFDNAGAAVKYGPQEYQPLYLARPFKESNTSEALKEQALNGQYCLPKIARTSFSIERVYMNAGEGSAAERLATRAHSLPISYRIIKVGFKAQIGTQVKVDPNLDLFVDTFGQPCGIDSDDFDRLDCRNHQINTKKYTKLMDMRGTIQQNNIVSPIYLNNDFADTITQKSGRSMVHMTVPFQLSARKNGKLFYETPGQAGTGPATFTSGGKRELLLIHTWFDNGHLLLGGDNPKAPTAADLQIKSHSVSAFVDAN
jgi:hypothetical protein